MSRQKPRHVGVIGWRGGINGTVVWLRPFLFHHDGCHDAASANATANGAANQKRCASRHARDRRERKHWTRGDGATFPLLLPITILFVAPRDGSSMRLSLSVDGRRRLRAGMRLPRRGGRIRRSTPAMSFVACGRVGWRVSLRSVSDRLLGSIQVVCLLLSGPVVHCRQLLHGVLQLQMSLGFEIAEEFRGGGRDNESVFPCGPPLVVFLSLA